MLDVVRTIKTFTLADLEKHLDRRIVREAVRKAIVSHARGEVVSPKSGELLFTDPPGECHIKFGRMIGNPNFVIKIASGFYDNPMIGAPVSSGVVLIFSAETGLCDTIFFDEGWLTSWRTAAAGSLASRAMARVDSQTIAIIGAGQQAELQAIWHSDFFPSAAFVIGARDSAKGEMVASRLRDSGLNARSATSIQRAVAEADIVVTTTPATSPLFSAADVRPGTHITAIGADGTGKQELDPVLLSRASTIATDDHAQCLSYSEFGVAVRLGLVSDKQDVALGDVLSNAGARLRDDITIADLTGLAAEDIAIASHFLSAVRVAN